MLTFKNSFTILILTLSGASFAYAGESDVPSASSNKKIVRWVGEIKDDNVELDHTTKHQHDLEFTNEETGKSYDIVSSDALVKLHCETGKNYLVEIEAELTPRVLFWGNNLNITKFKVLKETSRTIAHHEPVERSRPIGLRSRH